MNKLIALFFILPSITLADQVFYNPTVDINGVTHRLVSKSRSPLTWYASRDGFCRLNGFSSSAGGSARNGYPGPYAALDRAGNVIQIFPNDEDHFYKLSVITGVSCK